MLFYLEKRMCEWFDSLFTVKYFLHLRWLLNFQKHKYTHKCINIWAHLGLVSLHFWNCIWLNHRVRLYTYKLNRVESKSVTLMTPYIVQSLRLNTSKLNCIEPKWVTFLIPHIEGYKRILDDWNVYKMVI